MTKKEYLLKLIETLGNSWELGEAIKVLLQGNEMDDETIDAVYQIVSEVVDNVADENKKEKLKKGLTILGKIKELEEKEESHKQEELDMLLKKI